MHRDGVISTPRRKLPYPSLTVPQIMGLPVAEMAAHPAHLYLWTTNKYLSASFDICAAWGFRPAQTLVWAKTPRGIGPGGAFASNVEFVIFGRRGTLHAKRVDSSWWNWKRPGNGHHSAKPEAFLDLVEQVSPGPYLELFARRNRLGWDTWGNEALCHVNLEAKT
jgi:N6-adenosine-specific RNA methylase IME4